MFGTLLWAAAIGCSAAIAETIRKSGYALTDKRCGLAPDAYPKLSLCPSGKADSSSRSVPIVRAANIVFEAAARAGNPARPRIRSI